LPVAFHCGCIIALYGQSEGQKQLVSPQNKLLRARQKPLSIEPWLPDQLKTMGLVFMLPKLVTPLYLRCWLRV
jgi:hypothetical protein